MLFHRPFHLAKNKFLRGTPPPQSLCVTSLASKRGKELVSVLHGAFRRRREGGEASAISLSNHIVPGMCVCLSEYLHFVFYHYLDYLPQIGVNK